jgi:hypothetical protein
MLTMQEATSSEPENLQLKGSASRFRAVRNPVFAPACVVAVKQENSVEGMEAVRMQKEERNMEHAISSLIKCTAFITGM